MDDIFLSYASDDRARMAPLVSLLEGEGWSVWWDRDLIAGPSFAQKIQEALDGAGCVVVAWSKHSVDSHWCRDEANVGLERDCLVPLVVDDVRPPLGFRSAQTVFVPGWPEDQTGVEALLDGIRACLSEDREQAASGPAPMVAHERSVAVLPFANMSSDPEQEYFCDGLVEDIIADLAHMPQLFVVSRNATFPFKGSRESVRQIARQLGVNFVLQGSVRRSGERLRVTATLEDVRTSETIWSNRFDRSLEDVFAVQDELTSEIVTALDAELIWGEQARHRRQRIRNPAASQVLYKGLYEHYKFDRTAALTARQYFHEFIGMEPDSILGYVWLVTSYSFAIVVGWENPAEAMPQLKQWVDKALAIDPDDAHALTGQAEFLAMSGDLDGAYDSARRAVQRMPNFDEAWFFQGWVQMFQGEPQDSVRSLEQAMRLCPTANSVKFGVLGTAYRNAGRYEDAIQAFKRCLVQFPEFIYAHTSMAVVYGLMGDEASARREVEETLRMDPTYTVTRFITPNFYRDPAVMERSAEVLRRAGLPEGA